MIPQEDFSPVKDSAEEPSVSLENIDFSGPQSGNDEEGPSSSLENVIPVENLKKGWFALSSAVMMAAAFTQEKAVEAYNSEQVQSLKQKTAEIVTPAWEKTCEVAAPIWEKTKETASVAMEKTKEGVNVASERMRPTVETVSAQVGVIAAEGWKNVSEAATAAADYSTKLASQYMDGTGEEGVEYPASAMDSATRGGPMTL